MYQRTTRYMMKNIQSHIMTNLPQRQYIPISKRVHITFVSSFAVGNSVQIGKSRILNPLFPYSLKFDRCIHSSNKNVHRDIKQTIDKENQQKDGKFMSDSNKQENYRQEENTEVFAIGWQERVKIFAVEYGKIGIATHIVLSLAFFTLIYTGVVYGLDFEKLVQYFGFSIETNQNDVVLTNDASVTSISSSVGPVVVAYTIYKLSTPLRWPVTFAVTPLVLKLLRKKGIIAPSRKK